MSPLTPGETDVIRWFAVRVGASAGLRLLEDLENTRVEENRNKHLRLHFHISGRAPLGFEDTYPVSFASALDADGGNLVLMLWLDLDGTLYELHVSRVDTGPVQRPDWASLRAMTREEFFREEFAWPLKLGHYEVFARADALTREEAECAQKR